MMALYTQAGHLMDFKKMVADEIGVRLATMSGMQSAIAASVGVTKNDINMLKRGLAPSVMSLDKLLVIGKAFGIAAELRLVECVPVRADGAKASPFDNAASDSVDVLFLGGAQ